MEETFLSTLQVGVVKVALCGQHGGCYTKENIDRHLAEQHKIKRKRRIELIEELHAEGLAENKRAVQRPENGSTPLSGLLVHQGYQCRDSSCGFISTSKDGIEIHCRATHQWSSGTRGQRKGRKTREEDLQQLPKKPYEEVTVQTLWTEKKYIDYFVVQESRGNVAVEPNEDIWDRLQSRYEHAQEKQRRKYTEVITGHEHKSELTPWLRATSYHDHLQGLPEKEIPHSYELPNVEDEPELAAICESIERLFRKGMAVLRNDEGKEKRQLSRLNAKLLNTFRGAEMSQDPIKPLQNAKSISTYISCWQKLICYYSRVTRDDHLSVPGKQLFRPTSRQERTFAQVWTQAGRLDEMTRREGEDVQVLKEEIDQIVLDFSLSLIQHHLSNRAFDSVMVSFAAMLAWDSTRKTWRDVNNYTSYLSQLIYDCQIVVLLRCLELTDGDEDRTMTSCIVGIRDKRLLNDTPGPVSELSGTRLLGFEIGRNTVNQAQVRWHSDGKTVVYKEVQFTMEQLQDLVAKEVETATSIFEQDLCFGMEGVPRYDLNQLVDNWDASSPGQSFLTDTRNEAYIADGKSWIFDQLRRHPRLMKLLCKTKGVTSWQISSLAVAEYENAIQRFLESMLVLMHVASGQPARKPELLGLRWSNKQSDKRNLFIHDGYLLFILTYHKSLNMTNASRYPVRFLFPEVGSLLVQFLILVQPFRAWLREEVGSVEDVTEYLWNDGDEIWSENKMTRVFLSRTAQAIGVKLNVQAWRQLAVGIAIKKFSGQNYQYDLDLPADGNAGAEREGGKADLGGGMSEALHWQASHNPRTGNANYGGTVNFREGLTDAGLHEYLRASQMWHGLCRRVRTTEIALQTPVETALQTPVETVTQTPARTTTRTPARMTAQTPARTTAQTPASATSGKHARQESVGLVESPLAKRLAFRRGPQGCRRTWTMDQATSVLKQMHGPAARYKGKQAKAVQAIINNRLQVVAVLGTGEGKSLL
ncbi:hypothetical protein LTS18_003047, partial [Coniosporium uncinatum]